MKELDDSVDVLAPPFVSIEVDIDDRGTSSSLVALQSGRVLVSLKVLAMKGLVVVRVEHQV